MTARRFHRLVVSMTVAVTCVSAAGCLTSLIPDAAKSKASKSESTPPKRPPERQPQPGPPAGIPLAGQDRRQPVNPRQHVPPAIPIGARRPPVTTPSAAGSPYIQLSAGAALPQTLPKGGVMSFTAEYRFTVSPKNGVRYKLVVQGRGGKTVRVVLPNLKPRGQLPPLFTKAFRSNDGPFKGFIEEWPASSGRERPGDGKRVSNVIPLS
jgi:hypothetical protein